MVLNGPSNLVPVLRPKPGTNESPSAELSKMVIQQVLDQLLADFKTKPTENVSVRYSRRAQERPRANQGDLLQRVLFSSQHPEQPQRAASAEESLSGWWTKLPSISPSFDDGRSCLNQQFNQRNCKMGGAFKHLQLVQAKPTAAQAVGAYKRIPTVNRDSKVVRVFKTAGSEPRSVGLSRQPTLKTSDDGFQDQRRFRSFPDSSAHRSTATRDERERRFEPRPLYLREPSSDFWMIAPEAGHRSQSANASPTETELSIVMKVVTGDDEEVEKLIDEFSDRVRIPFK